MYYESIKLVLESYNFDSPVLIKRDEVIFWFLKFL